MTLIDFLSALAQSLDDTAAVPPDTTSALPIPIPHVIYDPTCREASAPDRLLIGLGHWQQGDRPVEHPGVCLNHKGIAERFGAAYRYATVTDLVLAPPEPLRLHWEALTAGYRDPGEILRHFTLIVEDSGPDSCFALLCWLARCCGIDPDELRDGAGKTWVQAVRHWETTGMAADPHLSWAALLSTLGHSYLPTAGATAQGEDAHDFSRGWREALGFTVALLRQGVDPNAVPPAGSLSGYVRARAFLDVERQDYLQSLGQAVRLQIWVPLAGTGGTRRLLVDAYFAVETWPSGCRKIFIRNDREHTYLRQGFALMGLYRPGEVGSGGDMTVSVNPGTGIDLKDLWEELERLETLRWQGRRPCDDPRKIASYRSLAGYNEPWWDDNGRYTLLGAPKALPDWPSGSRLEWTDVLESAWCCYSPVRDLRVRDLLAQRDCPLPECRRDGLAAEHETAAKYLIAAGWLPDTTRPQSLFLAPATRRALAALVARADADGPPTLADLPAEEDLTLVPLAGGFALLHERGVFLFEDWRAEPLPLEDLCEETRRCVRLLDALRDVEGRLAARLAAGPLPDAARKPWRSLGILTDLAAQRAHLAGAHYRNAQVSPSAEVRRFRVQLIACWGIDKCSEDLQRRLTQMEDAIRTASTLRTQGLVQILSVYGLPFFISGGILSMVGPWIETLAADKGEVALIKLSLYLGQAVLLIGGVRVLQSLWVRAAASLPKSPESRPVPEPTAPEA